MSLLLLQRATCRRWPSPAGRGRNAPSRGVHAQERSAGGGEVARGGYPRIGDREIVQSRAPSSERLSRHQWRIERTTSSDPSILLQPRADGPQGRVSGTTSTHTKGERYATTPHVE